MRTCIGCRQKAPAAELLRVVVAATAHPDTTGLPVRDVLPDPRHRASGRGAWVHPRIDCVHQAERRRAYGRALRCSDPLDVVPVSRYVAENR